MEREWEYFGQPYIISKSNNVISVINTKKTQSTYPNLYVMSLYMIRAEYFG